ncbi:MAG: portal protein [Rhodobacterales bacterium]|nr:portal protein [Rhodobacterales bacterium]
MAELFGFEIKRKTTDQDLGSFVPPTSDDGAVVVAEGGVYGQYVDLEQSSKTEGELVTRYRKMAMQPECENAIDDIVNESIVYDPDSHTAEINLDAVQVSDSIKTKINEEFLNVKDLLDFERQAYEIFRHWYIDGRMYYHVIIDEKNVQDGIQELRFIDPRKIRKVREVRKKRSGTGPNTIQLAQTKQEYYMYNDKGFKGGPGTVNPAQGTTQGIKIAKDSILHCTSGLMSEDNKMVLSHLHKAIKPLNQLRVLEDATVIYRISRAPERRIFYIDVGNLPKLKAEQYLRDMMAKHKNRLVYDANTGELRDDRKFMTMLEDYWLPRREGGKGTEITTLPAGQNLGEMDDVLYFQKKLYRALNVPVSRLEAETGFAIGRASEISRDEIKFQKFIARLRLKFSQLFEKCLEKQLILKGVITPDDWPALRREIRFDYVTDSHFSELKDLEIFREQISAINDVDPYLGKYFSQVWVKKNILRQTDQEIEDMHAEMMIDSENEQEQMDAQQADMDQNGEEPADPQGNGYPEAPPEQV